MSFSFDTLTATLDPMLLRCVLLGYVVQDILSWPAPLHVSPYFKLPVMHSLTSGMDVRRLPPDGIGSHHKREGETWTM